MPNRAKDILKKISIPEYFKKYIDHKVDLLETNKICCPWHEEDTPSFSYSPDRQSYRCFGSCKVGGDVISMHQKHNRLRSRDEAIESLASILGVVRGELDFSPVTPKIDESAVEFNVTLNKAERLAKSTDDYVELDYIMSQHRPYKEIVEDLENYITLRRK